MNTPCRKRASKKRAVNTIYSFILKHPHALLVGHQSLQKGLWSRASPPANHQSPSDAPWDAWGAQREPLEALDAGLWGETTELPEWIPVSIIKREGFFFWLCDFRLHYLSLPSTPSRSLFYFKDFSHMLFLPCLWELILTPLVCFEKD